MKNLFILSFSLLILSCSPTIYKSNNLVASKGVVKQVAILPYTVSIDSKRLPKGMTIETLKASQEQTGYDMQNNSYTWFLKRSKNYTVDFQDIDKTNAILKKANINSINDINSRGKDEICKLLGVDALISGKASMSKPMSEGAAIAVGLLISAWGSTNNTTITLAIHDNSSNLLWKYDWQSNGSVGSSPERVTDALMRNASKRFPYATKYE